MIRFGAPLWLLSLLVVPLGLALLSWGARRRRARFARLADAPFAGALGAGARVEAARRREGLLVLLGLGLVGAALARPQLGYTTEVQKSEGSDLVVALDLSRSMLAEDLAPSRLERAKIEIKELLRTLSGDRVGLVGFTTVAQPLSPLTTDARHVALQLERIQPASLPSGGTSIGAGIDGALALLNRAGDGEDRAERAIVVFTDGEDHEGDGQTEAKEAFEQGVRVHLVGLGGDKGEPIPLLRDGRRSGYVKDAMGRTVLTQLDPEAIRAVAEAGGGVAVVQEAGRGLVMAPLRRAVDSMRTAEREERRKRRTYIERYRWLLLPGLVLLAGSAWIRLFAASASLLIALTGGAAAQALAPEASDGSIAPVESGPPPLLRRWVPELEAARRALSGGETEAALRQYDAAVERLGPRPEILLGRGLARLRAAEEAPEGASPPSPPPEPPPEALRDLRDAAASATTPKLRAQAETALGNLQRERGDLEAAVEAYKRALRADPEAGDARRNLALTQALRRIREEPPPGAGQGDETQDSTSPEEQEQGQEDGQAQGQDAPSEDDGEPSPEAEEPEEASSDEAPSPGETKEAGEDAAAKEAGETGEDGEAKAGAAGEASSAAVPPEEDARVRILRSLEQKEQELQRKRLLKRLQAPRVRKPW
jgi:Ca-activated chloride channel homolog